MSLILPPFREERLLYAQEPNKVRQKSTYVTKLPYFFSIPTFSLENTWKGASEILQKYYFTLEKNFSILDQNIVPDGNYIPCIAWKPTVDTIVRYKLWNHDEGLLYAPLYTGQTINKNFYLEIWSTNNNPIVGGGTALRISQFKLPDSKCDTGMVDLAPSYTICSDMTFDMSNFDPASGDYYTVINTCLDTDQIFGLDTPEIELDLASAADNIAIDVINQESEPDFYEIWKKTSDLDWFLLDTIEGDVLTYNDLSVIAADFWQYKYRAKVGDEYSSFSNIVGISKDYGFPGSGDLDISTLILSLSDLYFDDSSAITSIDLRNLKRVFGAFVASASPLLVSINIESLESVLGYFDISSCGNLLDLDIPLLTQVTGNFICSICPLLENLNIPQLSFLGGNFQTDSCDALANITFSAGLFFANGTNIALDNCALPTSIVNTVLAKCVASGVTTCLISLDGQTPSAPPSGQGITDKATLIGNGNSVTTD